MSVFVDTSALCAVLVQDDVSHDAAQRLWLALLQQSEDLVSSNYVLTETFALLQRRLGIEAVRDVQAEVAPVLRVEWVDASLHEAGVAAVLTAGRRQLSLVDCVSFELMRRLGLETAFAFDDFTDCARFSGAGLWLCQGESRCARRRNRLATPPGGDRLRGAV